MTVNNILLVITTTLVALMAGVFFAFSTFVMSSINKLPPENAVSIFQLINLEVPQSLFGILFAITPIFCVLVMIFSFWEKNKAATILIFVAGVVYLFGSLMITMFFNIPLNNELATVSVNTPNIQELWIKFYQPWIFWNHVRTVASVVSFVLIIISCFKKL
jgi:uncharacterized membrane protein